MTEYFREKINVVIVEDNEIYRSGLEWALACESQKFNVVGKVSTLCATQQLFSQTVPDVVIISASLVQEAEDDISCFDAMTRTGCRVIVLADQASNSELISMVNKGAQGYFCKKSSAADILQAIEAVLLGKLAFTPSIAFTALAVLATPAVEEHDDLAQLTQREIEVLSFVAKGKSNKEVGEELCVCEATVSSHMNNVLSKLRLTNRVQATLYALRHEMVSL